MDKYIIQDDDEWTRQCLEQAIMLEQASRAWSATYAERCRYLDEARKLRRMAERSCPRDGG